MADHPPFRAAANLAHAGIAHGFFGREGGVSSGIYASLNCGLGSSDARENTIENRRRITATLGVDALVTPYQCHSADVVAVTEPWSGLPPRADGMVTNRPGIALGVLAADCAPVLFADPEANVIGAAHAGWRGALSGILENTLTEMENLGARRARIVAAAGPCIGPQIYEVGSELEAEFLAKSEAYSAFFRASKREGHFLFDLPGFARTRLLDAGIGSAETLDTCTYLEESRYFSYRRATHRGEADYGRNISAIFLRP